MEIIVLEAKATRLTNSCRSSGDRPDIHRRTADSSAAAAGGSDSHRCIVVGTVGKVRPCPELLRRDGLPGVDLPMLLPKAKQTLAQLGLRNRSAYLRASNLLLNCFRLFDLPD